MAQDQNIVYLENSEIKWSNFSGLEGKFNAAGDRNFCVMLEPDVAQQMQQDGWNIKTLTPRDEQDETRYYVQVKVSYKIKPPKVVLVTSRNKTSLPEDLVGMIDLADISHADLVLTAYRWNVNGKSGIKAYLKSGYFVMHEDKFDQKYIDVPDSAMGALTGGTGGELEDLGEHDILEIEG